MHVKKQHKDEIPPDADASEYWYRIAPKSREYSGDRRLEDEKAGSKIPSLSLSNPFSRNPEPQTRAPSKGREGNIIGRTVPADDFKHFQHTEADASTMESLMMARQQIAKGEALGGHDPMKWVVAIIVLLIGLGVAWMIFKGAGVPIPGIPSGGGTGTIP